jgi:(2Fe-2S) ferredoxin
MSGRPSGGSLREWLARRLGLGRRLGRRLYLCTGPDCCTREEGQRAWAKLEQLRKEEEIRSGTSGFSAARTTCLKVCGNGPIAYVHPDGTWYCAMTPGRIERVVADHLVGGRPVRQFAFTPPPEARPPIR